MGILDAPFVSIVFKFVVVMITAVASDGHRQQQQKFLCRRRYRAAGGVPTVAAAVSEPELKASAAPGLQNRKSRHGNDLCGFRTALY